MPSGSLTLLEAAKSGSDLLHDGVVETLIQESPLLEMLPVITIKGNAIKHRVEGDLPTPAYRQVNATYTRSWGSDLEHFWGVTILGGEVFIDNFIINTMGNEWDEKSRQYAKFAKAMSRTFDADFFDADGTANKFKGVNQLISEGFGLTVGAAANATNGGTLMLDDLDIAIDLLRDQSMPDAMLINRTQRRKITALGRTSVTGVSLIDVGTDVFGRKVNMYNGIPMRIIGDDITGTAILGYDETRGSSSVCSSIYFCAFGEDKVSLLLGAGGSFSVKDFGETQAAPGHLGRVECYPGIALWSPYSIVRLQGITNS